MEGGRLFLLRSGRDQISKGEGWSNHSLVLISTEIMNTIPFPVFGQFLRNSVGGRPDSRLRCGRRPRPPHAIPVPRVSARGGASRGGEARSGRALLILQKQLLFPLGGQGGQGMDQAAVARWQEREPVCEPRWLGSASPGPIHLEEEDRGGRPTSWRPWSI